MSSPNNESSTGNTLYPPTVNHVIVGLPSLFQMVVWLLGSAIFIIGTLGTAGAWYLNKSLEATQSKLSETLTSNLKPYNERQAQLTLVVNSLVAASTLSDEQKRIFNNALAKVTPADVKDLLRRGPVYAQKRSLNQLLRDKQVEQVGLNTDLKWDNGKPVQVRYIKINDPSLDLDNIRLVSDPDSSPCNSGLFQSSEVAGSTVQICETHLDPHGRLEITIATKPASIPANGLSKTILQ